MSTRRGRLLALLLLVSTRGVAVAAAAVDAPTVRILEPRAGSVPVGETRIEASVAGEAPGDQLDVFVNGRRIRTLSGPPWVAIWQPGETARGHEISVALRRAGREVARARIRTRDVGFRSSATAEAVGLAPIVTDRRGRFVFGLSAKNFTVLENGQPRRIDTFDTIDSPLSVVLVLDVSNSMREKMDETRRAAHAFVDSLKPGDEVALLAFNSVVVASLGFSSRRGPVHAAIEEVETGGETALYDVAARALQQLKPRRRRKAAVLFTDGDDNRSRLTVEQVIDMARASEVSIYSIAQGLEERATARPFLERIAEETGGRALFVPTIEKISEAFREILRELKSQYYLTYTPGANLKRRSWHSVEVRVNRPELRVRAKKQYYLE